MRRLQWFVVLVMMMLGEEKKVLCGEYKVGDLDSWALPTSSNPSLYSKWSKSHSFHIGDSLLFLYPPSQDSVIQITAESFKSCNIKNPILFMNDGNSLFNLTQNGTFFFTSGQLGHCHKNQKLQISVGSSSAADVVAQSPSDAAAGPSYPTVFGAIPLPEKSSSPVISVFPIVVASLLCAVVGAIM